MVVQVFIWFSICLSNKHWSDSGILCFNVCFVCSTTAYLLFVCLLRGVAVMATDVRLSLHHPTFHSSSYWILQNNRSSLANAWIQIWEIMFTVNSFSFLIFSRCRRDEAVMGGPRPLLQPSAAPHLPWARLNSETTWKNSLHLTLPPSPHRFHLIWETSRRHGGAHHTLQWGCQHRSVLNLFIAFHCCRRVDLYNVDVKSCGGKGAIFTDLSPG